MCIALHMKCPLFLSNFNETSIFLTDFLKILIYEISCKSVQVEPSCSVQGDGRTDGRKGMKLIFTLRNFANALKNLSSCLASVPDYLPVYRISHSACHFLLWIGTCVHEGFHYLAVIFRRPQKKKNGLLAVAISIKNGPSWFLGRLLKLR